mmetsp:Transcript_7580/g.11574  ORF Transcript_7580/g.11574 Transcript_7580/m.11574 type:complete len:107 (-) Transcript_7580:218-538(-)
MLSASSIFKEPDRQPNLVRLEICPSTGGSDSMDGQEETNKTSRLVQYLSSSGNVVKSGLLDKSNFWSLDACLMEAGISSNAHPFKLISVRSDKSSGVDIERTLHLR